MDVAANPPATASHESRWRSLEATAPFYVATLSEEGRLASLNQALSNALPAESIGRRFEDWFPPDQAPQVRPLLLRQ